MCYSIFDYRGKIQLNFSQTEEAIYSDFMFGKETSHELSYGKQLSPKVGRYIHKFLKKFVHSCPVLMRLGETPVSIPNTTVKT